MITGQKPASIYCIVVLYCIPLAAFASKNKAILESELIKPLMFYYENCTVMRLR